jgi:hypothetical protein
MSIFNPTTDPCAEFRNDKGVCLHGGHVHDTCTCNEFFVEPDCLDHIDVEAEIARAWAEWDAAHPDA